VARRRATSVAALRQLGITVEVVGAERVPAEGGLVLMWNQESHLDHLVLAAAIPRPIVSLYDNAVARIPVYGPWRRRGARGARGADAAGDEGGASRRRRRPLIRSRRVRRERTRKATYRHLLRQPVVELPRGPMAAAVATAGTCGSRRSSG
jgi:hypothetical protein